MAITVIDLSKAFAGVTVLDHFSAVFPAQSISVIMGPSGSGKTTLLRLLMGLEQPDSGQIVDLPARVSAVFQEDRLCLSFSAVANVRMVTGPSVSRAIIEQHLHMLGLAGSIHQPVRLLSGGMQRRVCIVRAMLADSDLVLLDEPFKGLDSETKKHVMDYVRDQAGQRTVIVVTHDAREAAALAPEVRLIRLSSVAKPQNS